MFVSLCILLAILSTLFLLEKALFPLQSQFHQIIIALTAVSISLKLTLTKRCISSHKIKSIDIEQLKPDIFNSLAWNTGISHDVNDLVSRYFSELTSILDIHPPTKETSRRRETCSAMVQ